MAFGTAVFPFKDLWQPVRIDQPAIVPWPMPSKLLLPQWIPPQLSQLVETAPSGQQWVHEIKLDGFRMSVRIEKGVARLLTRTGLDWSAKYPVAAGALSKVRAQTAYLDGELCGIGDDGLPSFAQTQAATDGARGVRLVFFAFDLLHLNGRDIARLPLIERKALLEPLVDGLAGLQFNGHETGDGELIRRHACKLGFEGYRRPPTRPMRRATGAYGARQNASTGRNSWWSDGLTPKAPGRISARFCSAITPTTAGWFMLAASAQACPIQCSRICGSVSIRWRGRYRP